MSEGKKERQTEGGRERERVKDNGTSSWIVYYFSRKYEEHNARGERTDVKSSSDYARNKCRREENSRGPSKVSK